MLTGLREAWQRRRGQTHAGSWAAQIVARTCGTVVVVLVISSWPAAAGATAATARHSADPAPQKAPTTAGGASQPAPDPAPQAASTAPASHRSASTGPVTRVPVIVTPTTSAATRTGTVGTPTQRTAVSSPPPAQPVRHTSAPRLTAHRASPPHHAQSQPTHLSFPLALPRALLFLPDTALRAGDTGHRNGVLLLLTSLAMAVLAVASFMLLRRLRRLELR